MDATDRALPGARVLTGAKIALFVLSIVPLALLGQDYADGALARPWQAMIVEAGDWSIRFLVIALCISPLIGFTGWRMLGNFRRMAGLFGAFYAALHVFAWTREYGFDWPFLTNELLARHYLTIGAIAVLLLVPLAATSADVAHRALGPARWRRLHQLMYPAVIAAFAHYAMARGFLRLEVLIDGVLIVLAISARLRRGVVRPQVTAPETSQSPDLPPRLGGLNGDTCHIM